MARNRAERRALAEKALAKVKRDLVHGVLHGRPEAARWFVKARKRCSCWMCGNPRRYFSGPERIPIQERKADEFASHIE